MHIHIQTQAGGYQQLARSARGSASTPLGDGWRSLRESRGTRLQLCRCWWLTRLCLMQLHEPRRRMGGRAQRPARFQSKAQFPPFHPAARKLLCPLCACALVLLCSCAPVLLPFYQRRAAGGGSSALLATESSPSSGAGGATANAKRERSVLPVANCLVGCTVSRVGTV